MLDTNTASFLLNGRSPAVRAAYFSAEKRGRVVISAITEAEIRFGFRKDPEAVRLRSASDSFLAATTILLWDSSAAEAYAELRYRLSRMGKALSDVDLFIAAHASAVGATLVTHDRAFAHLASLLRVEDWATDIS